MCIKSVGRNRSAPIWAWRSTNEPGAMPSCVNELQFVQICLFWVVGVEIKQEMRSKATIVFFFFFFLNFLGGRILTVSKPCPSQVPIKKLIFPFLTHTRHEWTCVNAVPESYTCQTRVWCPFSHVRASQNKSIHIHFGLGRPPFLKKECQITFLTRNRLSTLRKPKLIINRNLRQFLTTNQLVLKLDKNFTDPSSSTVVQAHSTLIWTWLLLGMSINHNQG